MGNFHFIFLRMHGPDTYSCNKIYIWCTITKFNKPVLKHVSTLIKLLLYYCVKVTRNNAQILILIRTIIHLIYIKYTLILPLHVWSFDHFWYVVILHFFNLAIFPPFIPHGFIETELPSPSILIFK